MSEILSKQQLRAIYIKKRGEITHRAQKDLQMRRKVIKLLKDLGIKSVFTYVSIGFEADTHKLIALLVKEYAVYVPHTYKGQMKLLPYSGGALFPDKLGNIYADSLADAYLGSPSPDAVIVPMVAFDGGLNRLGYGGGYYDRYLSASDALKIGIAYDVQYCDGLPLEIHDRKLDIIVTPDKIYKKK